MASNNQTRDETDLQRAIHTESPSRDGANRRNSQDGPSTDARHETDTRHATGSKPGDSTASQRSSTARDATSKTGLGSYSSLLSSLLSDGVRLVQDEVALAKTELSEKTSQTMTGIGSIATGGAVLFAGFLVLLAAAVYGLNMVLPPRLTPWLSALIVGGVVAVIGFIMLQAGRRKLKASHFVPERTTDSLRRDRDLVRSHEQKLKGQAQ